MKLFLVNAPRYRDADVRRALRAAIAQTAWPRHKPIYVGCWPRARSVGYRLHDIGISVYIGPRTELWQLAEMARFAARRLLGARRREAGYWPDQAPAWCVEAGLVGARPRATTKSAAQRRLVAARANAKLTRIRAREALHAYEAARLNRGAVERLAEELEALAGRAGL